MYLASGGQLSYTLSVECVVGWIIREMQPVLSENFRHSPITSCSCEKRYQALHALLYCKQWKAGQGLGMRLLFSYSSLLTNIHSCSWTSPSYFPPCEPERCSTREASYLQCPSYRNTASQLPVGMEACWGGKREREVAVVWDILVYTHDPCCEKIWWRELSVCYQQLYWKCDFPTSWT